MDRADPNLSHSLYYCLGALTAYVIFSSCSLFTWLPRHIYGIKLYIDPLEDKDITMIDSSTQTDKRESLQTETKNCQTETMYYEVDLSPIKPDNLSEDSSNSECSSYNHIIVEDNGDKYKALLDKIK